jgi:hypothetical protein
LPILTASIAAAWDYDILAFNATVLTSNRDFHQLSDEQKAQSCDNALSSTIAQRDSRQLHSSVDKDKRRAQNACQLAFAPLLIFLLGRFNFR